MPDIEVVPGQIRISSVDIVAESPGMLVIEIDCDSKYPRVMATHDQGEQLSVMLYADDDTLRTSDNETPTEIILPPYTAGWQMKYDETGKYTVQVVAWEQDPARREQVWPRHTVDCEPGKSNDYCVGHT